MNTNIQVDLIKSFLRNEKLTKRVSILTCPGGLAAGRPVTMETRVTKMAADNTSPLNIFEIQ